jgi:hypothetical protein
MELKKNKGFDVRQFLMRALSHTDVVILKYGKLIPHSHRIGH